MGFGLLFIGFMMMLDTGWTVSETYNIGLDIFPDIVGYLLMVRSMRHLRKNSRDFNSFTYIAYFLSALGAVTLLGQLVAVAMRFVYPDGLKMLSGVLDICTYIKNPIMLAALLFLTSALRGLARELELSSLAKRSTLSMIASALYYLLQSVLFFASTLVPAPLVYGTALLFYVQLLLLLTLIFSFYRQVGYEGEDTSVKEHPLEKLRKKLESHKNDDD